MCFCVKRHSEKLKARFVLLVLVLDTRVECYADLLLFCVFVIHGKYYADTFEGYSVEKYASSRVSVFPRV